MAGGSEGLVAGVVQERLRRWNSKEEQRLGWWRQLLGQRVQRCAHLQPVNVIITLMK